MKRSPLNRGKPLARGDSQLKRTPLARGESKLKRTELKRHVKERESAGEWARLAAEFHASVQGLPCVVCGRRAVRMDAHHVVPKQKLTRLGAQVVWDTRNAAPVHRRCHLNHECAARRIERSALPFLAVEFAEEVGLSHLLESLYAEG